MRIAQPSVLIVVDLRTTCYCVLLVVTDTGVVICLARGANDLHMVQLMPQPPYHLLPQ